MKRLIALLCSLFLTTLSFAAPLASNAKTAIPSAVQQIISVDYRALRNSDSGMALKAKILPDNLKQFENALKDMGIDPDRDVEGLSFVMFRAGTQLRSVGFATGDFQVKKFLAKQKAAKTKAEKYRTAFLYPAGSGMLMTFLDDTTMLFGDSQAVHNALDARDGEIPSVTSNADITFNPTDFTSATTITLAGQLTLSNASYPITINGGASSSETSAPATSGAATKSRGLRKS